MTSVRGEVRFTPVIAGHRLWPSVGRGPGKSAGPPAMPITNVAIQSEECAIPSQLVPLTAGGSKGDDTNASTR
eukprot:SAG22_NODE_421_length_10720_cov_22.582619_6_plen_73_part_00